MDNIKQLEDGTWCPSSDTICYDWTMKEIWIPEFLSRTCDELGRKRDVLIHAGGNMGIYTKIFAAHFEKVFVFEPEDDNFTCLALNCCHLSNVFMYKAALGAFNKTTGIDKKNPESCGNHQVTGRSGRVPMLTIDNLCQDKVALIHLDIEGYELFALQGAVETIKRCRPLIAYESVGGYKDYNYEEDAIPKFLYNLGYTRSSTYANEVMFYY